MDATTSQDQQNAQEGSTLVHVLSTVLDRLCIANVNVARTDPGQVTKFHAMKAPGIGVLQYLERIHKYASCSNECFVLALIYIDRLIQRNNFLLTELNVHRVVITAVLLAAKFFDDAYYNNAYYAKVGGVLVSEMNGLEVDFLFRINFSLHVTPEVFEKYRAELLSQASAVASLELQQQHQEMHIPVSPQLQATSHHQQQHYTATQHQQPLPSSPMATTASNTSPTQMMCNPQAPVTHGFPPTTSAHTQQRLHNHQTAENPYMKVAESSQITPPPGSTQMAYVHTPQGIVSENTSDPSVTFPIQFTSADGQFVQVQRANSYPATAEPIYPGRCGSDSSYSAPAVITPAVHHHYPIAAPSGVASMMEHQIFPLQNALVHHNHGATSSGGVPTSNPYAMQPKPDPRGHPQMLTGGVL